MTRLTITGRPRHGRSPDPVTFTWRDGDLTGDPVICGLLRAAAVASEGTPLGFPAGPSTAHHHLASPWSVLALAALLFHADYTATGDLKAGPQPPPGAIV